jgi:hypothetical protein
MPIAGHLFGVADDELLRLAELRALHRLSRFQIGYCLPR